MQISIKIPEQVSESALSDLQKEYRKFFRKKLKESGKEHPFEGTEDEIADFFGQLSEEWAEYKKSL